MELNCPHCKSTFKQSDEFCSHCKFPLKGTEKEKLIFIGQNILKKDKVALAVGHRKVTKYILLGLGSLNIGALILNWIFNQITPIDNYVPLLLGFVFISLSFIADKKPLFSLSSGLALLLVLYVTNYIIDPETLWTGFKSKIVIIGMFSYGLYVNLQAKKIKSEHKNL